MVLFQDLLGVKFKVKSPIYEKLGMVVSLQEAGLPDPWRTSFSSFPAELTELYQLPKPYITVLFFAPVKTQQIFEAMLQQLNGS